MPIVLHQFGAMGAAGQPGYFAALELARQCVDQYHLNILLGAGGGIAAGSCWAAVAVVPNGGAGFPAPMAVNAGGPVGTAIGGAWGALPYSMVFGNSQMAGVGAMVAIPGAPGALGNHAERNALIIAGANGLALYQLMAAANHGVMFVQLAPCGPGFSNCAAWLAGAGGGVANPYAVALGGAFTMHVWYRWPHPAGVGAMMAWNGAGRGAKLADINANW
jgi:hypothetical protein